MAKLIIDGIEFEIDENQYSGNYVSSRIVPAETKKVNENKPDIEYMQTLVNSGEEWNKVINAIDIDFNSAVVDVADGGKKTIKNIGNLLSIIKDLGEKVKTVNNNQMSVSYKDGVLYMGNPNYEYMDVLWSDGAVTHNIRPLTENVEPVAICVIPTGFYDSDDKARFVSLETVDVQPVESTEPYAAYVNKSIINSQDVATSHWYKGAKAKLSTMSDISDKDNCIITSNVANHKNYAVNDIDGLHHENFSLVRNFEHKCSRNLEWYVPATGELLQLSFKLIDENTKSISQRLKALKMLYSSVCGSIEDKLVSSTMQNTDKVYTVSIKDNSISTNAVNKDNNHRTVLFCQL